MKKSNKKIKTDTKSESIRLDNIEETKIQEIEDDCWDIDESNMVLYE